MVRIALKIGGIDQKSVGRVKKERVEGVDGEVVESGVAGNGYRGIGGTVGKTIDDKAGGGKVNAGIRIGDVDENVGGRGNTSLLMGGSNKSNSGRGGIGGALTTIHSKESILDGSKSVVAGGGVGNIAIK